MCGIFCQLIFGSGIFKNAKKFDENFWKFLTSRGPDAQNCLKFSENLINFEFFASVLHIRGMRTCRQPLEKNGRVFVFNGEIFDGLNLDRGQSDTEAIFENFQRDGVLDVVSRLQGPFAFIYYEVRRFSLSTLTFFPSLT